jgi:phenylacetate-CoA ligase
VPASSGAVQRQVKLIEKCKTTVLCCTPSLASRIAARAKAMEADLSSLRIGIFGGEPWSEAMRACLERDLGIESFDHYGFAEAGGPGVAYECPSHDGLHVHDDFRVDVLNAQLIVVGDGPVYTTGDEATRLDGPCSCGFAGQRISRIVGRLDDRLNVNGVMVWPSAIEDVVFGVTGVGAEYQISNSPRGLHIRVESTSDVGTAIARAISDRLCLRVFVTTVPAGTIDQPIGKTKRVLEAASW